MDHNDIKIIKLLQKNARITASEIAGNVNLSVPAVSDRLRKLEASGIIQQYTAIVNPRLLKKDLTAIMYVSLERPKYSDKFSEFVLGEDEILDCYYLLGDYDYALKIVTESTYTLEKLINRIKSMQWVAKTRTIVVLSTVKQNYSVSPAESLPEAEQKQK